MKITVYGTGCQSCKALHKSVLKVVQDNAIVAEVVYENDLRTIIAKGIMQMPALEVDGKIKFAGRVPKENELVEYLK